MSNIIPFDFRSNSIRVVEDGNGEPWFVLADICRVLEIKNPTQVAERLDDDEKSNPMSDIGLRRDQLLINESGLYSVILRSDKPEAKPFKKWVTSEVLPSIRKTGGYSAPNVAEVKPLIEANKLFKSNLIVAKTVFKGNQALLSANQATYKATEVDVLSNIGATHLLADTKEILLTATDVGKRVGLSAMKVNVLLEGLGLQVSFRDLKNRKLYELTKEGEKYAEALDTGKKHGDGTPVKQIKWHARVVDLLNMEAA